MKSSHIIIITVYCLNLQLKSERDMDSSVTSKDDSEWSTNQQMANKKVRVLRACVYTAIEYVVVPIYLIASCD